MAGATWKLPDWSTRSWTSRGAAFCSTRPRPLAHHSGRQSEPRGLRGAAWASNGRCRNIFNMVTCWEIPADVTHNSLNCCCASADKLRWSPSPSEPVSTKSLSQERPTCKAYSMRGAQLSVLAAAFGSRLHGHPLRSGARCTPLFCKHLSSRGRGCHLAPTSVRRTSKSRSCLNATRIHATGNGTMCANACRTRDAPKSPRDTASRRRPEAARVCHARTPHDNHRAEQAHRLGTPQ